MTLEPVPDEGMSSTSPGRDRATPDSLRRLARRQLERRIDRGPSEPAISVLGIRNDRTTLLRHGFDRPADVVLGLHLPARYRAVLTLASSVLARHTRLDHGHLAIAVNRDGTEVCMVATGERVDETFHPCGWLVDACRRSLGLPSRPEPTPPLTFPLTLWLDRLMVAVVHTEQPISWSAARACCPVPSRWGSDDPAELGATLASVTPSWARLRTAASAGGILPVPIEPAHAAWMDDAMFARWCLGFFPELDDLRADVEFVAPPDVAARVAATIDAAQAAASS